MKLVTAVITTHKRSVEILERALNSVLSQTYSNMETIVVDDSPEDYELRNDVKNMVESYASQNVKYIQHEECKGACAARNTGIDHASGEFIAFLDDDDEWKPTKIEKQLSGFTHEAVALVYCGYEIKNDTTGIITHPKLIKRSGSVYPDLLKKNFIGSTSFPLLRKSALVDVGGFDVLMQSAQDCDVWLRLAKKYEVACVDESLILYHVHAGERITTNPSRKINGLERLNEKNWDYIQEHKEVMHIRLISITPYYAANKQLGKALKLWLHAVCIKPFAIKKNLHSLGRIVRAVIRR